MQKTNDRMTEEQVSDLLHLAAELQAKAEARNDRDTAVMAYAVQKVCLELTEFRLTSKASEQQLAAVVAALEAKDRRNAELNSTLERWSTDRAQSASELDTAEKRIAELESRTVTVKLPKRSVGEVMHMSGFSRDYAEGWCSGNDNAINEMKLAGIQVIEGEGQ